MKNLILIILLLSLIGCGTDQGKGKTYIYTVKNESGKEIKIKAFRTTYPASDMPTITIFDIGEELTKTYTTPPPPSVEIYSYGTFFNGDSLVVIFNNERYEIFTSKGCSGGERNPLNRCVYFKTEETFVFTEEDYENAEPCDGECQ